MASTSTVCRVRPDSIAPKIIAAVRMLSSSVVAGIGPSSNQSRNSDTIQACPAYRGCGASTSWVTTPWPRMAVNAHNLVVADGHRPVFAFGPVVLVAPGILLAARGGIAFVRRPRIVRHKHQAQRAKLAGRAGPRGVPLERSHLCAVATGQIAQHIEVVRGAVHQHGVW